MSTIDTSLCELMQDMQELFNLMKYPNFKRYSFKMVAKPKQKEPSMKEDELMTLHQRRLGILKLKLMKKLVKKSLRI